MDRGDRFFRNELGLRFLPLSLDFDSGHMDLIRTQRDTSPPNLQTANRHPFSRQVPA